MFLSCGSNVTISVRTIGFGMGEPIVSTVFSFFFVVDSWENSQEDLLIDTQVSFSFLSNLFIYFLYLSYFLVDNIQFFQFISEGIL